MLRATARKCFGVLGGVVISANFDVEATNGVDEALGDSGGIGCVGAEVTWTMVVGAPAGAVPGAAADGSRIDGSGSSPLPPVPV